LLPTERALSPVEEAGRYRNSDPRYRRDAEAGGVGVASAGFV